MSTKSITELRAMAQALGVTFSFSDTAPILQQKIDLQVMTSVAKAEPPPVYVPMDARLRNKPPSKEMDEALIRDVLHNHIARGLSFRVEHDTWFMKYADKEDSGTMHCPPRIILECATKVMS